MVRNAPRPISLDKKGRGRRNPASVSNNLSKPTIMYKIYVMVRGRKIYTGDNFYTIGAAKRFCKRMNKPIKGELNPQDYYFIDE